MRAVLVQAFGGPDVLAVAELPDPVAAPGEVVVEVRAAGVNFADVMARLGHYAAQLTLPYLGGFEFSGVVVDAGDGSSRFAVGDRVAGVTRDGAFAEFVAVDARDLIRLPDTVAFAEGAAVPINYATARAGLVDAANLRAGERVLVMAAAGGVGIASVQIAAATGAEVWGAASPGKHSALRALGVHTALDYTAEGWDADLPAFDVVMDALGGASFARSYDALRPGGRLVAFGAVTAFDGGTRDDAEDFRTIHGIDAGRLMIDSKTVTGLDLRVLWDDRDTLEPWLLPIEHLLHGGLLGPVVAAEVAFSDAAEAHRILTGRRNIGKVVLVP